MSVADAYRQQAERCRKRAEEIYKPEDGAFWLLLAEKWQSLAQALEERRDELHTIDADKSDVF
jgi:hypothetical protein